MTVDAADRPGSDSSAAALAFIHRLLCSPDAEQVSLHGLLTELAEAFAAPSAGLGLLVPGGGRFHGGSASTWEADGATLKRLRSSRLAVAIPRAEAGSVLATVFRVPDQVDCLLWIEDGQRREWTAAEAGALPLAGGALERWLVAGECSARWVEQMDRHARQQRLETMAQVARRLAHDFSNVFTGILGFTELSLGHPPPGHALILSYLNEIFRSAQNGARLTNQLRLFSGRQQVPVNHSSLAEVVEEEVRRLLGIAEHAGKVRGWVMGELPPVAIDKDHLRHVVAAVLENAVEALPPKGEVAVAGRTLELEPASCTDYYGDLKPGPHVLLTVADAGSGLTAEGWQRVLVEPFYTTKPRHRGLGLAIAYGILHAHQGGLRLLPRPGGGLLVEVLLPTAPQASLANTIQAATAHAPSRGETVLVVDDDPAVLDSIRATLEQAGYQVKAVTNAEDALHSYLAGLPGRFQLVLSDVVMPRLGGVELARQLLKKDANVRLLFMSGRVGNEFTHNDLGHRFGLLCKPFAREGLLRAVRSALDRPSILAAGVLLQAPSRRSAP